MFLTQVNKIYSIKLNISRNVKKKQLMNDDINTDPNSE